MRKYPTGATRDISNGKNDYEGFLNPLVIKAYGDYMHKHRKQADGELRDSDNWQRGIEINDYMKCMWRHFLDLWSLHRGYYVFKERLEDEERTHILTGKDSDVIPQNYKRVNKKESLCAILFNVIGYLFEHLKGENDDR